MPADITRGRNPLVSQANPSSIEDVLRLLEEAKALLPPTAPVELDAEFLHAIARVEELPENQSGSDKTWVEEARSGFRRYYEQCELVR